MDDDTDKDDFKYRPRDEHNLPTLGELREMPAAYNASPAPELRVIRGGRSRVRAASIEKGGGKVKTSVYLEAGDVSRLSWLAEVESRPQAEIIRDAIRAYQPHVAGREFALFRAVPDGQRRDADFTQDDIERLMDGFGGAAADDGDR